MTRTRFELVLPPWKGGVLTTWPTGLYKYLKQDKIYNIIIFQWKQQLLETFLQKFLKSIFILQLLEIETILGKKMAPKVGLEPTTNRLTAGCSTTELLRNNTIFYFYCTYIIIIIQKKYASVFSLKN